MFRIWSMLMNMMLVSDSIDVIEEVLRTLHTTSSGMGLSISCKKSKILAVCPTNSTRYNVELSDCSGEEPVAVVEDFQYLGCTISHDCSLDREFSKRISKASQTFHTLYRVLWCETEDQDQATPVQGHCSFHSTVWQRYNRTR